MSNQCADVGLQEAQYARANIEIKKLKDGTLQVTLPGGGIRIYHESEEDNIRNGRPPTTPPIQYH